MNAAKTIITTILFICLLLLVACGDAECRTDAQCPQLGCYQATCSQDKVCLYEPIENCCGNGVCEVDETRCICSQDCKPACEGPVVLEEKQYQNITSNYISYQCNENQLCEIVVSDGVLKPTTIIDDRTAVDMKLGLEIDYNQPFDITNDQMKFTVTLEDDTPSLKFPVKVRRVQIVSGQELLGSKNVNENLKSVGDSVFIQVPITATQVLVEEEKNIRVKIDYDFTTIRGASIRAQRDSYEKSLVDKITFVETGVDE